MLNTNDRIYLGAISGMIGNAVSNIFGWTLYFLDINKFTIWHIAASAFFPRKTFERVTPLLIGAITDYTIASFLGVIIVYLLYFTGLEHPIFKSIGVSMMFWVIFYGIIVGTEITAINPTAISTNVSHLIGHIILGLITSLVILRYGKEFLINE